MVSSIEQTTLNYKFLCMNNLDNMNILHEFNFRVWKRYTYKGGARDMSKKNELQIKMIEVWSYFP